MDNYLPAPESRGTPDQRPEGGCRSREAVVFEETGCLGYNSIDHAQLSGMAVVGLNDAARVRASSDGECHGEHCRRERYGCRSY